MTQKTDKRPRASDQMLDMLSMLKTLGVSEANIEMGEALLAVPEVIPTGQVEVDNVLGEGGGIPEGTLVEFCGEPSSGKTYLSLKLIAQAQKLGKRCAFFNIENTFVPQRAIDIGVNVTDPDQFMVVKNMGEAERYGEALKIMVDSGKFGVIVVDSITAMIPRDNYDRSLGDTAKVGAHASFVGRLTQSLIEKCAKTKTIVILINQFRFGSGVMPNTFVKKATGGEGLGFYCHMRLWINKLSGANGAVIGDNGDIIGGKSKVMVKKTRYGMPGLTAEFPIMYGALKPNPISEFLYRASAKGHEYITVYRKEYRYADKDTGEVMISDKNPVTFMQKLLTIAAPEKRTRGDNSNTAFEYVCGRLKLNGAQMASLRESIQNTSAELADENSDIHIEEFETLTSREE